MGRVRPNLAPDGSTIQDPATLDRIRALAIPPAYTNVWICPDPLGHLQATGFDARGRKQRPHIGRAGDVASPISAGGGLK
jgi:DNA topoisomerase-1